MLMIMEFLPGGTLEEWIKFRHSSSHEASLYSEEARRVMASLLRGLAYVHSRDYIHRDVKPENIMFAIPGDTATLKIADFGMSTKYTSIGTDHSSACGTVLYMAPEMLKSHSYNTVYISLSNITPRRVSTSGPAESYSTS